MPPKKEPVKLPKSKPGRKPAAATEPATTPEPTPAPAPEAMHESSPEPSPAPTATKSRKAVKPVEKSLSSEESEAEAEADPPADSEADTEEVSIVADATMETASGVSEPEESESDESSEQESTATTARAASPMETTSVPSTQDSVAIFSEPTMPLPPKSSRKRAKKEDQKKKSRKKESFSIYIYKVMRTIRPDIGISSTGMTVMESFVDDIFERIANESARLAKINGKRTISDREICTAARLTLPGSLSSHSVAEANKCVASYLNSKEKK